MRDKQNPKRLWTRLGRLFEDMVARPEDDHIWPPKLFYQNNPQHQISELVFDPKGDNQPLLDELMTRAAAHGTTEPFLVTDVLIWPEMERVAQEWTPFESEMESRSDAVVNMEKWQHYESEHKYRVARYEQALGVDLAKRSLSLRGKVCSEKVVSPETLALLEAITTSPSGLPESTQADESINSEVLRCLSPELMRDIQRAAQEPQKLSLVVAKVIELVDSERAKERTMKSKILFSSAKADALELAQALWEEDETLTKEAVTNQIQQHLVNEFKDYNIASKTILGWITPLVPDSRKAGGRPRKRPPG